MRVLPIVALVLLFLTTPASAQVTNGDFNAFLTGWTTSATPPITVYMYPPFGLPNNSAHIDAGTFGGQIGSGSISQTFQCGSGVEVGTCVIAFDYYLNSSSATVKVEGIVDGNILHSVVYPTEPGGWVHVVMSVECGMRTITIKGSCSSAGAFARWNLYIDNVTGNCEAPVPTESSTWGKIKSLYR